jgi:hypothetical protein
MAEVLSLVETDTFQSKNIVLLRRQIWPAAYGNIYYVND